MTVVGLISDTHGLLRPEAISALSGSDLILHTGDVDDPGILEALRAIAPLHAVRGNVDHGAWAEALPMTETVEVGGKLLYMIHILDDLDLDPGSAGIDAVICGHSHQPKIETHRGVCFINPGSAGRRRFRLPVTVGRLTIRAGLLEPEIIELAVEPVSG